MARRWQVVALLVGLFSMAVGSWSISLASFGYLAYSVLQPSRKRADGLGTGGGGRLKFALAGVLVALSAIAFLSGGVYSPFLFLLAGSLVLGLPSLTSVARSIKFVPVDGTILLRSDLLPFLWASLAELKPGPEPLPRGASAYSGVVMITDKGRAYSLVTCLALGRGVAEAKVIGALKASCPRTPSSAYLYPLAPGAAAEVLSQKLSRVRPLGDDLEAAKRVRGCIVLDCKDGFVRKIGAYTTAGPSGRAVLPAATLSVADPPLLWEVLDAIGKRTGWPEPDQVSDLLDSLAATRGVPISERLSSLEATADGIAATSTSGQSVQLTRPQLRALLSIYE